MALPRLAAGFDDVVPEDVISPMAMSAPRPLALVAGEALLDY
jgi:hypothetical protein